MSSSIHSLNLAKSARQANIEAGLDSYFPFDPFTLPRSKRFIDHLYRTWGEVAIEQDSDDEEDEDVKEEMTSEAETESALGTLPSSHEIKSISFGAGSFSSRRRRRLFEKDNGLSSSLEGMSISPSLGRR